MWGLLLQPPALPFKRSYDSANEETEAPSAEEESRQVSQLEAGLGFEPWRLNLS